MEDSTWIRSYGSKSIYHNAGILRTDGTLQVGSSGKYLYANSSAFNITPLATFRGRIDSCNISNKNSYSYAAM
jgi:hypothetical protein